MKVDTFYWNRAKFEMYSTLAVGETELEQDTGICNCWPNYCTRTTVQQNMVLFACYLL
jgi:hypothetical protein